MKISTILLGWLIFAAALALLMVGRVARGSRLMWSNFAYALYPGAIMLLIFASLYTCAISIFRDTVTVPIPGFADQISK